MGVALQQAEGFLDGIDERPVEGEQVSAGATCEDEACHVSSRGSSLGKLAAQIVELDAFAAPELGKPNPYGPRSTVSSSSP